ncbi:MAG: AbrB/MazE/SpoVT family DNA-binding domain-containing protein [Clostridia bacterium]|nr:AbrB/MazE/SpoVT family DNA-binding domain-containing protein [Clostridia bacterium]
MKATGIVRRIDDLGRVVIPKEIRRTMRIREGDPLEIYTDIGGEVIFKKYSPIGELSNFATEYADALLGETRLSVLICDRDRCVSVAGISKRETLEKTITKDLRDIIENRSVYVNENSNDVTALEGLPNKICAVSPIISSGDLGGAVVLVENSETTKAKESDLHLINVAAKFLGNQMA